MLKRLLVLQKLGPICGEYDFQEAILMNFKRMIVIVMDSVGAGHAPDAAAFGDEGANTLEHIDAAVEGMHIPNLLRLGLGNIVKLQQHTDHVVGSYGVMREISAGKDTTSGHWEMMGNPVERPFPVFYHAFPAELLQTFTEKTGHSYIGNEIASGTEIIERLGPEHFRTKAPIVYTSADSVFQIAAHTDVIPLEELYRICEITRRQVCVGPYECGRIIARPFIGVQGNFIRTGDRRDYSRMPERKMVFSYASEAGLMAVGIGKIGDIYAHIGLTESYHTADNKEGMQILSQQLQRHHRDAGIIMVNLVDFDSMYGHRRNPAGYGRCIEEFDQALGALLPQLNEEDVVLITADHGNDPTWTGTDHTREQVPLLVYSPALQQTADLGVRTTYADLGQTIMENFKLQKLTFGTSFLQHLK
ncbi:phosphopentomutase [Megasphaera paucivorans]|uniref:Phosphopentomutase n=2 Tax=Megasphaera paucivorans TaxID=349095 RepID=A0A1G9UEJ2_9FIRM|nr:phosphopentomutase [Megasphaera paucivorans]